MVAIIFFFVLLIFGITLFATNNTATIPNKNILLGVTLPTFALKDGAVTDIVKKYKKSFYTLFLGSFVFTLPIFVFGSYPSFTMIYAFIWIALLLYFNNKIYKNHYKLLSSLKRKNDWFDGTKTNGAATDRYSLGNFNLSGYGRSKMYVHNENPPFIAIKLKDLYLFLNGKSREVTEQYYNMLLQYTN